MWEYHKKSSPIKAKGGIKARSKKGSFSYSWWGKRWIEALESFEDSARLGRGRSYARKGQVLSININNGQIIGKVQGSCKTPYRVEISFEILSINSWKLIIDALSEKAIYTAKLLAGDLPSEIEDVFEEVNLKLLPSHYSHLKTDCSCPDWSNPCKHIAAVLYLLGEEFDRDPFLLFKTRGIDRETFLNLLENKMIEEKSQKSLSQETQVFNLSLDQNKFWQGSKIQQDWLKGAFDEPKQTAVLAKSLGKFPFWHGENDLHDFLKKVYINATDNVLQILGVQTTKN